MFFFFSWNFFSFVFSLLFNSKRTLVIPATESLEETKIWFDMNQEMSETLLLFYCYFYCRPCLPPPYQLSRIHVKSLPLNTTYKLYVKSHKWRWTSFEPEHNGATERDQLKEQCPLIIWTWTLYGGSTKGSREGKVGCVYDNVKVHHHCVAGCWPNWRSVVIILEERRRLEWLTFNITTSFKFRKWGRKKGNKEGSSGSVYNNDKGTERDEER